MWLKKARRLRVSHGVLLQPWLVQVRPVSSLVGGQARAEAQQGCVGRMSVWPSAGLRDFYLMSSMSVKPAATVKLTMASSAKSVKFIPGYIGKG